MADKVTFDGVNKIIQVENGVTELIFDTDVYAVWKKWAVNNLNFSQAMTKLGGETIVPNQVFIAYTFQLLNGWKIRPYEGQHILQIKSNVFSADGTLPYTLPNGFDVLVNIENDTAGGLTTLQDTKLTEIWRLLGLDPASQVLVTKIGRITSGIAQTFQSDQNSGNVIITREP
jgi:hypothetical protein